MRRHLGLVVFALILFAAFSQNAWALKDFNTVQEGLNSWANDLVELLGGPGGAVLAGIGAIGLFFESKFTESKLLMFGTFMITIAPFLIALVLKTLYL
ncbi:hypothetical protein Theam_1751 (plasmid) [Thermovibrio ammonificans HB-1]|uniref:Conjugal transfer protein TrbC n=1 Tax=Thermovibrio ammonificans (strain DSM 15698 / JCM 12110 / HB-1) TaxID=648996 RepID=E8T6Y6_THEA1|nr:hypothetical protein [Thermovibrio ammonificans]ADU97707.1 hypothetical protein Theam_1751 [Thermovibrio ammonificans HB-1]